MRRGNLVLGCAAAALVAGAWAEPLQVAQLQSIERRGSGATVPPPTPRVPVPQVSPQDADPSGVWFYVRRRDPVRARAELARLQAEHPGWRVPEALTKAMAGGAAAGADPLVRRIAAVETAIRANTDVARELDALTPALQRRSDSATAERFARAYLDGGAIAAARAWFDRAFVWSKAGSVQQAAAVNGLVEADTRLGQWAAAARDVALLPQGEARAQAAQILSDAAATAAETAARIGDWLHAEDLAAISERAGRSRVRIDLGWAALDAGDGQRSAASFATGPQTEESRYGRMLALSQAGDIGGLAAACVVSDRSERQSQACGDAFAGRALAAYESKDWAAVIGLDATARGLGLARSGTRLLAGWSHYRRNDYAAALTAFDEAALSEPDAADGIVQTLVSAGRMSDLQARAAVGSPQMVAAYRRQVGQLALIRKRMIAAAAVDAPGTRGLAAPSFTTGLFGRDKTGASGADRLTWLGVSVAGSVVQDDQRFSIGVDAGHLQIGAPPPGAPIGSLQPTSVVPDRGAGLATPWLRWERDGIDRAYTVTLGTTPVGGRVGALPVGVVSAERDWDQVIGTVALRASPRYDSLLAMAGMKDGATGSTWGRVVEIGPQLGAIVLLNDRFSISGNASVGALTGRNVAGNSHVAAGLSLTYEFKPTGFDYVRIGPAYGFDHYRRNENFFTIGNGGYYSPNAGHSFGGFLDFLTTEGRTWQIGGRLTAAWQHSAEDAGVRLPLADDGSRFPGKSQSQVGTDSVVRAATLIGSRLILGGYGRVTYAPTGRDLAAGITLTLPFAARDSVLSSDLPHFADRSWP